ncbi:MAG: UvrB/UvrC motif-containing protein [Phycisphaeraceae bacterium]|nr:UvrB/UvrC motif-containing protein [Phycisphaeraceae bacterium]
MVVGRVAARPVQLCVPADTDSSPTPEPQRPTPREGEPRESRLARLLVKARALPAMPGVYLMKDAAEVVLYVGKASRLNDRVSSYFIPSADLGPRKQPLLDLVHDFETIECEGEWEALLTENRLIKDISPRFNARLTDDKTYPYLVVTAREDFPRVVVTRNLQAPEFKGARVFGPFTRPGALREAVTLLQRVFKFRTCSLDIVDGDGRNAHFRPCLLYNIGMCTAPCAAKIAREPYRADVDRFVRFLTGKRSAMLRQMQREMNDAAAAQEYEKAAVLRDQIKAVQRLDERARRGRKDTWQPEAESFHIDPRKGTLALQRAIGADRPIRCIEAIDIAHLQGGQTVGSKVCFVDGRPLKNEYRRYRIKGGPGTAPLRGANSPRDGEVPKGEPPRNDDYASIREVVSRRYREAGTGQELYPDAILIDGGLGQLHAAMEAFGELNVQPPLVLSLAKKEEILFVFRPDPPGALRSALGGRGEPLKLGRENLGLKLCQAIRDEAHRFAQHYHHVLRRKKTLDEE